MKKKEKKAILILIIVSILIIGGIWLLTRRNNEEKPTETSTGKQEYVQVQEDGTKVNTSDKVKEEKEIEGVSIENIRITEKNGQTVLVADITNTTDKTKERFLVDIVLYDAKGREIGTIPGVIGEMQVGETIEMQAGITEDYVNAYNFKIVKK